jgi:cytochrome c oxidase subunit III
MEVAVAEITRRNKIHPYKFAMWVACGSLLMLFASLTSAYIVRQSAGNWLEFGLPEAFGYSTLVIFTSSITLHLSFLAFKKERETLYKVFLIASAILGMVFFIFQYKGWVALSESGVPFTLNPSGDFVYVISWVHGMHVVGGLAALCVALIHAFGLPFRVTNKRKIRYELTLTYWHFVDILWIYLFFFLSMYR